MINITLIGALTSKPYAFTARSWELKNIETIDLFDSTCSNIRTDIRGSEIMRILPVNNEYVNEEWISDKTRFAYDGLKRWRFTNPLIKKNNSFIQVSWKEAFNEINRWKENNNYKNLIINTGNFTDLETITSLKKFCNKLDNVIINPDIAVNADEQDYVFPLKNFNIKSNKIFILIGINLRFDNPILNIKLRKLSEQNNVLISYIGPKYNYNINNYHIGTSLKTLTQIISGKHKFVSIIKQFYKANKIRLSLQEPIQLLFGNQFINIKNSSFILSSINNKINNCKNLKFTTNILPSYTGQVNLLELNLNNNNIKYIDAKANNIHYLLGTEKSKYINRGDLVIFQGHHNDLDRTKFDVILPSYNWTEKSSIYLNSNNVVQKTNIVSNSLNGIRNDWKIVRMISILFNADIKYNNVKEIHNDFFKYSPNILNSINKYQLFDKYNLFIKRSFNTKFKLNAFAFNNFNVNFYGSTSVERASKIMNNCSNILYKNNNNFTK